VLVEVLAMLSRLKTAPAGHATLRQDSRGPRSNLRSADEFACTLSTLELNPLAAAYMLQPDLTVMQHIPYFQQIMLDCPRPTDQT
jgi:hypothetical protein